MILKIFIHLRTGNLIVARGKILLIDSSFDNFKKTKIRPVLCLTNPIGKHDHVIVSFITSNTEEVLSSEIIIHEESLSFIPSGLKKSSKICLHKLITIPIDSSKRELGSLSEIDLNLFIKKITGIFNEHPR